MALTVPDGESLSEFNSHCQSATDYAEKAKYFSDDLTDTTLDVLCGKGKVFLNDLTDTKLDVTENGCY